MFWLIPSSKSVCLFCSAPAVVFSDPFLCTLCLIAGLKFANLLSSDVADVQVFLPGSEWNYPQELVEEEGTCDRNEG